MRPVIVHILAFLAICTGIAAAQPDSSDSGVPETSFAYTETQSRPFQVGTASWYGKGFDGKKTANGETYSLFQLTAAHRTLPLGSFIKVTNLRNRKWVIVRINDRGPVRRSRVIDLSYAAAGLLGLRGHGIEKVKLDLVEPPHPADATVAENQPLSGLPH
ncbi:MAG: septal ring lytic transglycosylase RlpA family protein [Terriglobales bacterium]|jgi:rare lipoprotein A